MNGPNKTLRGIVLGLGYFFLYVPIISLMVFSFNESPTVTSWTGFSFRWYHSLFNDDALLRAAWLSFRIAAMTATAAVIIGTWAGYVLGRMGRFRGFALYVGMLSAPLVIPEVVLGISLLLMFVELRGSLGWPAENGIFTIWVGHAPLGTNVNIDARTIMQEKMVMGSMYGSARPQLEFPRLLRLYQEGKLMLDELITRSYPLSGANEAFASLGRGEVARSVLQLA